MLHPTVDGAAVKQHGLIVQAEYGPLQAADISFTLHHSQHAVCCGESCRVQIQVGLPRCKLAYEETSKSLKAVVRCCRPFTRALRNQRQDAF